MTKSFKMWLYKELPDIFVNICSFIILSILIIITSILIFQNIHFGLVSYSDDEFNWNYKPSDLPFNSSFDNYTILYDNHCQTTFSDGSLTPKQVLEWHIANGYNAVAVTDHNSLQGAFEARELARSLYNDKIKVLIGMEFSCCRIHMNLIGINTPIMPPSAFPTDEELQKVINDTHSQGGFVTVNHLPWSLNGNNLPDHPTLKQLYSWGVDYVEVVWQNLFDYQDYLFAVKHGMGIVSGTDLHSPQRGTNGWTTLISNFTEEAILQQLRERRTSIIYNSIDSPYIVEPFYTPKNLILNTFFAISFFLEDFYYEEQGMYSFMGSLCKETKYYIFWNNIFVFIFWVIIFLLFFILLKKFLKWIIKGKILRTIKKRKEDNSGGIDLQPFLQDKINNEI